MRAAVVREAGQAPVYGDFPEPQPASGRQIVTVKAASISHITRSRAAGRHYSSANRFPFVPGVDGVGVTAGGRRVYFLAPHEPYGALAERCLVPDEHCIALPDTLADDAAAAMAIAGMSSWAALAERAQLRRGETVLINGSTGTSGRLAIQIAKHLGAKKVIATGRQSEAFAQLRRLGADVTLLLTSPADALADAFRDQARQGIDVILDYLWGPSAEALIVAAAQDGPEGVPLRYVQIGSMGGASINLPSAALRSSALQLMGSGIGSVPFARLLAAAGAVLAAAPAAGFEVTTRALPLAQIGEAWTLGDGAARIVLNP
jgi:NADPH:quinone reductase-like Zn-dependent oxidoreductase